MLVGDTVNAGYRERGSQCVLMAALGSRLPVVVFIDHLVSGTSVQSYLRGE